MYIRDRLYLVEVKAELMQAHKITNPCGVCRADEAEFQLYEECETGTITLDA